MTITLIDYDLRCSCNATKTAQTRRDIIEWFLDHQEKNPPASNHKPVIIHFLNNKFRQLDQQEIDEFIEYIKSGKAEKNDQRYPFGDPGLGGGPDRPYSNRTGIPR